MRPEQPMPSKSVMPARDFPHTFPTWISAIHLKLKFKINGVDESKTEHDMTGYSGTITHFKSTIIIQDEEPI